MAGHIMRKYQDIAALIVGAGPTGLTLACDLARRGLSFRIVDKAPQYFPGSRGKGLQPRSLEVLDDLGVVDQVLANGRFHLPFRGYDGATVIGDHDMHEGRVPTPDIPYASPLIIPQWRVEEILRNRLAEYGGRVELATELIGFELRHSRELTRVCSPKVTTTCPKSLGLILGSGTRLRGSCPWANSRRDAHRDEDNHFAR